MDSVAITKALIGKLDADLRAEIAKRPRALRLPRQGTRFQASCNVEADLVTNYRPQDFPFEFPIDIRLATIPKGELLLLDYEPDPSHSTHCMLTPERYGHLEGRLVEERYTKDRDYSGYKFSVSYTQLDANFEWLVADNEPANTGQPQSPPSAD